MRKAKCKTAAAFLVLCIPVGANASVIVSGASPVHVTTINPTSDGALYACSGCNVVHDSDYVLTSDYIQGAIKFSRAAIPDIFSTVFLTVNPYALPLWGPQLSIYGYGTANGQLAESDANAGVFLGILNLPPLGWGADAYFDVTSFVKSTDAPYLALNLRSSGTNVFSSLEYNYGHPSQLQVISFAIPEPASATLIALGLVGIGLTRLSPRGVASKSSSS
jgi:hypothetical protein